ncbi:MAG: AIM24 family protein [Pseudomonas sp.]|uniref:AIM24 family protein n=1 Tax=Pseudomonas sp. TaxID=306 RepID=UPI003399DDE2
MNELDLFDVVETERSPGAVFEVVQYKSLKGSDDLNVAEKVFFANQAAIHLKMVRITLDNSQVLIEPGALYFMKGDLQLESAMQGGMAKGLMRKFMTGETLFQSRIKGSGEIYLEPTFGHYLLFNIDNDALIFDKAAFYCGSGNLEVSAKMQSNVSSALFGGEGFFQTQVKGSGIVVLNSPVPVAELLMYELAKGEKLSVDGDFAFVRTASVSFQAEKSGKSLFQSVTSGEGLLQTFTGPGVIWLAPTQAVYAKLKMANGFSTLTRNQGSMGTKT